MPDGGAGDPRHPARFIVEEPLTTRPNRGDFAWKWQRRPQPLRELYLDAFFEKCFGMYAGVKRQGLDRASKKDIAYCTTWLRGNDWRRVEKRLPDGQRVTGLASARGGWKYDPRRQTLGVPGPERRLRCPLRRRRVALPVATTGDVARRGEVLGYSYRPNAIAGLLPPVRRRCS